MEKFLFFFLCLSLLCLLPPNLAAALPLRTSSRRIVDETGGRVKLACVIWPSHREAAVAEGLSNYPVDLISKRIASTGFNCVRLAFPVILAADRSLAAVTVRQSFQKLRLIDSIAGFQANNPSMLDLPLISAYQEVVSSLADNNLMVILSSHLSEPSFHGDGINPELWVKGLTRMATMSSGVPNVVGMCLGDKFGFPKQNNVKDWYRYVKKGTEAVHSANPHVLVIISGLGDGTDLSFLLDQQPGLTFTEKVVLEMDWHGLRAGRAQETGNPNKVCGRAVDNMMRRGGALLQKGWPLMVVSELGVDDDSHLDCFFGLAAKQDFDWGLMNSSFFHKISGLESSQGRGGSLTRHHQTIYHPSTNQCILRNSLYQPLRLGPCTQSESWGYTPQKMLIVKGTYFCLKAVELGKPARLSILCNQPGTYWETVSDSDSKTHLSTTLEDGTTLCLDADSNHHIVTNTCQCSNSNNMCDPKSQWFKVEDSSYHSAKPIVQIS